MATREYREIEFIKGLKKNERRNDLGIMVRTHEGYLHVFREEVGLTKKHKIVITVCIDPKEQCYTISDFSVFSALDISRTVNLHPELKERISKKLENKFDKSNGTFV